MKKETKFAILIVVLVLLCLLGMLNSCTCKTCNEEVKNYEYVHYETSPGSTYSVRVLKFEYDGHQYIMFGAGQGRSIVHDPDCNCKYNSTDY